MDSCSTLRIRQSSMCVYDILVCWQLCIKLLIFGPAARWFLDYRSKTVNKSEIEHSFYRPNLSAVTNDFLFLHLQDMLLADPPSRFSLIFYSFLVHHKDIESADQASMVVFRIAPLDSPLVLSDWPFFGGLRDSWNTTPGPHNQGIC